LISLELFAQLALKCYPLDLSLLIARIAGVSLAWQIALSRRRKLLCTRSVLLSFWLQFPH
jgi:hypothetical protein